MTRELYLEDAYLSEFTAKVVRNSGREVVLDRTAFYPGGAGQPSDKGGLSVGPVNAKVIEVRRDEPDPDGDEDFDDEDEIEGGEDSAVESGIIHVLDQALPKTIRELHATLDWPRRHRNMRYNTALALMSAAASRDLGATPNIGRIRSSRARLDLTSTSVTLEDSHIREIEKSVNEVVSDGRDIAASGMSFEVAGLPRGAGSGGLHVGNTSEVGRIEITRWFDRGSRGVRLEFTITDEGVDKI